MIMETVIHSYYLMKSHWTCVDVTYCEITILCSPTGMEVRIPMDKCGAYPLLQSRTPILYAWENSDPTLSKAIAYLIGSYWCVARLITDYLKSLNIGNWHKTFHCAACYDNTGLDAITQNFYQPFLHRKYRLKFKQIFIGPEGIVAGVELSSHSQTYFKVKSSVPHCTLAVVDN